jgi:hypothetical protein
MMNILAEIFADTSITSISKAGFFSVRYSGDGLSQLHIAPMCVNNICFMCFYSTEETLPKNIATSIKDEKFINLFFSRIRWASLEEVKFLEDIGLSYDYPFVSPCGKEINFIRPAATPIVFHSMINQDLIYGGNLTHAFDHTRLAVSKKTGRLYHQLFQTEKRARGAMKLGYGLIRSSVAVSLSEKIFPGLLGEDDNLTFFTPDGAKPIQWLPVDAEPSTWAMPGDGND